ncbi:4-hydroxy-3-methylbut-2-enyl diphosphate reductase [uncultured Desulfobacterium sp.]|uniref:4-hydroxy-3-methylbut-2-enyl diphosphate reductase n=1 Tax=uncultured Desulfobacterium sp. TaxID=201089 RepID=A0A445MVG4_9BACT|nr:4-hydroxy-3-methylbut-2-enyl diphosphate reductase [uncultured Desulfobacterium sp.]
MKVKLAKTAGFCMGVRRAMELVLTEVNKKKGPLFTFGPLIHNNQVLDLLESKGVKPIDDLTGIDKGAIAIRAHGISPKKRQEIKETGLKVIDATCPKVAKVQALLRYHTKKGSTAVIVGNRGHAEVVGLLGYCKTPAYVIETVEDVNSLPDLERVVVVAQTTQNVKNFSKVAKAIKVRFPYAQVLNTICNATSNRQKEVRSFAGQVDATVVVGGFHSGNTCRLVQVSRESNTPTFHVETEKDLDRKMLSGMKVIGVTAGASTPNWMIKKVVSEIEGIRGKTEGAFYHWLKRLFKSLLANKIGVSFGAFCLSYATAILIERPTDMIFPSLAFLYIYAMHVLNRFLDRGASAYNDPERAFFLKKHRPFLIVSGIVAVASSVVISFIIGLKTFLALCGLSLIGLAYSLPLVPERIRHRYSYYKIKDIPGSRSLSESLAWVAIVAVIPILESDHIAWPAVFVSAMTVFTMSYVRSTLFDIFDVQGDLIVGIETLPISIGTRKTLIILKTVLVVDSLFLLASPLLGLVGRFSFILLIPVVTLSFCLVAYERRWIYPGSALEAMVEGNFVLAGLLALIWQGL